MLKTEPIYFRIYKNHSREVHSHFSASIYFLQFFFFLLTCLKWRFYLDKHNTTVTTFCFLFRQFFCVHRWQKQKSVLYSLFWSADKFAGKILYFALLFFCVLLSYSVSLTILTVVANFRFLQPSRTAIELQWETICGCLFDI